MDLDTAKAIVAAGEAKYARAAQMLYDWQYNALEKLRDEAAISEEGFNRMISVPHGRIVADGGKGGPWIGARTLTDGEVIDAPTVATDVLRYAHDAMVGRNGVPALGVSLVSQPFLAPIIFQTLAVFRDGLRLNLGWYGRLLCATPLGCYVYPRAYVTLAALAAILSPPESIEANLTGG